MADDKRADEAKKNGAAKAAPEDMTPAPTQAELDGPAGEKAKKEKAAEPRKASEDLTPTPTQAEADDTKAKLFGTTVEEDHKRRKEYEDSKGTKAAPEDMTPVPTQAENDQAKLAAMYVPEGAGDPQKVEPQHQRRTVEASKPGGYQTRASEAATAKAE